MKNELQKLEKIMFRSMNNPTYEKSQRRRQQLPTRKRFHGLPKLLFRCRDQLRQSDEGDCSGNGPRSKAKSQKYIRLHRSHNEASAILTLPP